MYIYRHIPIDAVVIFLDCRAFENPKPALTTVQAHVELIRNEMNRGWLERIPLNRCYRFSTRLSVFRHIFKGRGRDGSQGTYVMSTQDFPRKYFPQGWDMAYTKCGTVREIIYPLHLHIFLSRSCQLYNKDGSKKERSWIQKPTDS